MQKNIFLVYSTVCMQLEQKKSGWEFSSLQVWSVLSGGHRVQWLSPSGGHRSGGHGPVSCLVSVICLAVTLFTVFHLH